MKLDAALKLRNEDKAEAEVVVPVGGVVVATIRDAAVPGVVVPTAAAQDAERPRRGTLRVGLRTAAVAAVPVGAPPIDVAAHIVQA